MIAAVRRRAPGAGHFPVAVAIVILVAAATSGYLGSSFNSAVTRPF